MSDFLIFKAAFNNSATPAIGTYTAEGATASFTQDASLSPDYYLYNTAADSTAVQWFVPTKETTDFEFVADILTDDQSPDGDRYFIIADSTGTTGLCMLSSSSITEWRFMNGDSTATSDPEYVGAIDPTTSGGFGVFHRFRVRVRKLTASSSSVEVYVDGALKLTATAGAALVTCAKIGFIGGVTGSPSTSAGIQNVYVYDLSGRELVDRGVLSGAFNRFINWAKGIFATKEDYVPRSGGAVMSGTNIGRIDDTNQLVLSGGDIVSHGAYLALRGQNASNAGGTFNLCARTSSSSERMFIGFPSGTLQWFGQPIQYASDQRLKQQINQIDDKLLDAWEDVELSQFKYNDAVDQKGDNARLHTGYVVQQIDKACASHGVDVSQYGLYCHEEYPEETEEVEVEQKDGTKTKERKVIREASEHYSLRYTEVYAVECMYLRRCIARLTARIEELEKGNDTK